MPIATKDYRKVTDEASRNQLFMMFVEGELKKLKESIKEQGYILDLQDEEIGELGSLVKGARSRIYTLEKKHLPKKVKPKVKQEQPWWLKLVTKNYK